MFYTKYPILNRLKNRVAQNSIDTIPPPCGYHLLSVPTHRTIIHFLFHVIPYVFTSNPHKIFNMSIMTWAPQFLQTSEHCQSKWYPMVACNKKECELVSGIPIKLPIQLLDPIILILFSMGKTHHFPHAIWCLKSHSNPILFRDYPGSLDLQRIWWSYP